MVALTACAPTEPTSSASASSGNSIAVTTTTKELTVVTHESFALPDELKAQFEEESGYNVSYVTQGDAGALVNQMVLTKDSPLGDVVFGIDNTFAGRAIDEGIVTDYQSAAVPESAKGYAVGGLNPIDMGDVCINADTAWFTEKNLAVPATFDDLTKAEYKDLLVVSSPASSSPGLAFLTAIVGAKGADGYLDYWKSLKDNGLTVVPGWSDAYNKEFSAGEGAGSKPLVLSYSTSPAFTVNEDASASSTTALLDTCFRQVEYAGVVAGAKNEPGAQAFIDFLLSDDVQASIPENMYMYPVTDVPLPAEWEKFAPLADEPVDVSAEDISEHRDEWIQAWNETVVG